MYRSLTDWLNPLPGGLLHTNGGFRPVLRGLGLVGGDSGNDLHRRPAVVQEEELRHPHGAGLDCRRRLARKLIPPGIAFIIYGVLTNTSVARLYAGGVFPGALLTVMFMTTIVLITWWRPSIAPREVNTDPMLVRLKRLVDLLPPVIIFVIVMGSIYSGWATSTEAAALAVIVTLPIAAFYGRLSIGMLHDAFLSTVNLTALSMLILAGAFALNFILGLLGVTAALTKFVASLNVTPLQLIYILFAFYVILGTFFETLPMMVGTLPLVHR